VLAETPLSPDAVQGTWAFYQTLDGVFVLRRARDLLEPPPTVMLRFEGETLTATGTASAAWLAEARRRARFVAGVTAYDDAGVD
jgi:hypothetical protein